MEKRKRYALPYILAAIAAMHLSLDVAGQFEQKMSVNISGGYFNTIGWKSYEPDPSYSEPTLMPNFKGGPSAVAGIQYNFSRHFSVEFQIGYSLAPGWFYDASDEDQDPFNYLYFEIYEDTVNWEIAASGENYMDMTNIHFGIAPRYYFLPAAKLNPFLYGGVTMNLTSVYFEDHEYDAYASLGRLDEWEGNSDLANWFEDHTGFGIMAGAGAEYTVTEHLGLIAMVSYHFIPLKSSAFIYGEKHSDFHDISIHLGVRLSFLKSKNL